MDVNKGDKHDMRVRSRIVAQEINLSKKDNLFAATRPLELKKALMKLAVTEGIGYRPGRKHDGMHIAFMDVKKAYYASKSLRDVCVKLPPGDEEEGMCGKVHQSIPGMRDAAKSWEMEYSCLLYTSPSPRDLSTSRMPSSA